MANDAVNHPSHYTDGEIEVITYIDDKNFNYCRGNAIKYISRAGKKNPEKEIEDLKKAEWYIHHEIERLQKLKEQKKYIHRDHYSVHCESLLSIYCKRDRR